MSDPQHKQVHRFGPFVLDGSRGSLSRNGEVLRLRPKSFQVLEYLLQHQGRLVTKRELLDAVWQDVSVTEDSLVQCLVDIRKVLGEAHPFLRTVPRRGYTFEAQSGTTIADAQAPAPGRPFGPTSKWVAIGTSLVLIPILAWAALSDRGQVRESPEAAALYARGLHHREQGTRADIAKAEKFYQAAIQADPNFARAYTGLADVYLDLSSPLQLSGHDVELRVQELLATALSLDPKQAEAHALMGTSKRLRGDYAGADEEFRKSFELAPDSVTVLTESYRYALALGDYNRAMEYAQRWCELDPLSSRACAGIPATHLAARRYDQALDAYRGILAKDPGFAPGHTGVAIAYIGKGLYPQAIAALEYLLKTERAPERIRFCLLAFAYARTGRTLEARAMLQEMVQEKERRSIPEQFFAVVHAGLSDHDAAFESLDRTYPDRPGQPLIKLDQPSIEIALEVLRADPRYSEFAKRKGFSFANSSARPF